MPHQLPVKALLKLAVAASLLAGMSWGQTLSCPAQTTPAYPNLYVSIAAGVNALPVQASPLLLRSEGTTELVSDLVLINCTSSSAAATGQVVLFMSQPVTSKAINANTPIATEATLLVTPCTSAAPGVAGNTCTSSGNTTAYSGTVSGNTVQFTSVAFPATFNLEVANIRVNATGTRAIYVPVAVTETLDAGFGGQVSLYVAAVTVGQALASLVAPKLTGVTNYAVCTGNPATASTFAGQSFTITATELLGSFFKSGPGGVSQSVPSSEYGTYVNAGTGAGVPNSGTRLQFGLYNVPSTATIFVPTVVSDRGAVLTLTSSATGPFSAVQAATTPASVPANTASLAPVNGVVTLVYEITASTPATINTFSIPVYVAFPANTATPNTIVVIGAYAPLNATQIPGFVSSLFSTLIGPGISSCTPTDVSVSPSLGAGLTQTFAASYREAAGANTFSIADILFNTSVNGASACFVEYNLVADTFRLLDDAGRTWLGPITLGAGSLSNSQCTINGAGGATAVSGTNLTVAFPITFNNSFVGHKNIYLYGVNNTGLPSAILQEGTWEVGAAGAPQGISLTPATGSGAFGTLTGVFNHTGGASQHYLAYMLLLPTPNVVNYTARGSCLMEYNRIINGMRLVNDAGTDWLGGLSGVPITTGGTLSNSVCTLNVGASSAQFNGTLLTVSYSVSFAPGFQGRLATFLQELDLGGNWAGVTQFGNWTAFAPTTSVTGPNATAVTPASGAGSSATFTTTFSHSGGLANIYFATMLIGSSVVGSPGCQAYYFAGTNKLNLINDAGTGFVSASGVTPGAAFSPVSNSKCSLTAGTVTPNTSTLATMALTFSFSTTAFGGAKNVYVDAFDNAGLVTHWVSGASWTVQ